MQNNIGKQGSGKTLPIQNATPNPSK